jgi:hypothetical protein
MSHAHSTKSLSTGSPAFQNVPSGKWLSHHCWLVLCFLGRITRRLAVG